MKSFLNESSLLYFIASRTVDDHVQFGFDPATAAKFLDIIKRGGEMYIGPEQANILAQMGIYQVIGDSFLRKGLTHGLVLYINDGSFDEHPMRQQKGMENAPWITEATSFLAVSNNSGPYIFGTNPTYTTTDTILRPLDAIVHLDGITDNKGYFSRVSQRDILDGLLEGSDDPLDARRVLRKKAVAHVECLGYTPAAAEPINEAYHMSVERVNRHLERRA